MKLKISQEKIFQVTQKYFEDHNLKDLMQYGDSDDDGLLDISDVVADIVSELGYQVDWCSAESWSDGKYTVYLQFVDSTDLESEVIKAWYTSDQVAEAICHMLQA